MAGTVKCDGIRHLTDGLRHLSVNRLKRIKEDYPELTDWEIFDKYVFKADMIS